MILIGVKSKQFVNRNLISNPSVVFPILRGGTMKESDRWLFNYRTIPLNEPDSDSSDDDSKKQIASEESQLWSELDISSRSDAAVYKPNPFSIAKINAASRSRAIQTQSNIIVGKSLPPLGKARTIEQLFNEIQQKKPKDHVAKTASHGGGSASRNKPSPPILTSQTRLPLPARDSATRPEFASPKHTSHAHTSTKCSSLTTDPDKTLGQLKKTPSTLISPQQRRLRHLPARASVTPSLVESRVDWELQTSSSSRQAETKLNPTTARGHSVLFISKRSGNTAPCNVRTPGRGDALAMNSAIQKSALSRHVMTSQNNPGRPSVNRPPLRNLPTYTPTLTSQTPKCYDFMPNSDESWSTLPPPKKKLKPRFLVITPIYTSTDNLCSLLKAPSIYPRTGIVVHSAFPIFKPTAPFINPG